MQIGTPMIGVALQHSIAPTEQLFSSMSCFVAMATAAQRSTLSGSIAEVSMRAVRSA